MEDADSFKIEMFVIRVGDWGGYMLLDCDEPLAVHKFCSMLPAFMFEARPVVPVMDAVRVELEAMAFRDGLTRYGNVRKRQKRRSLSAAFLSLGIWRYVR